METIQDTRRIPVRGRYDVIVAGGGVAGVSAALAAAREGSRTLLIEKSVQLGGLGTLGLISWYEPLCDGRGRKMIGGIAEELLRLAIRFGPDSLPGEWRDGEPKSPPGRRYSTHFSPTMFAMALDQAVAQCGAKILLDTLVTCPVMEGGHCSGLIVEDKEGRGFFGAKALVDATGDADVFHRAGAPCVEGRNFLTFVAHAASTELAARAAEEKNILRIRKWEHVGSDLFGNGHPEGMKLFSGVTGEEVTEFVLTGRRMLFEKVRNNGRFLYDPIALPNMAQLRTTRHIRGGYELSADDLAKRHEDSIGAIGDFRRPGDRYEVPYRCLWSPGFDNLLAAGRIVSASGDGWEVTRVIPAAALTGQAAGTAAALCVQRSCGPERVEVPSLQRALERGGVTLHI